MLNGPNSMKKVEKINSANYLANKENTNIIINSENTLTSNNMLNTNTNTSYTIIKKLKMKMNLIS